MSVRNFRDLIVWQEGMALAKQIYLLTNSFPTEEKFGLVSQMRRCSVSVPSNIAEGHGRSSTGDYLRFLSIACGSLAELETQVVLSVELGFVTQEATKGVIECCAILGRRRQKLRSTLKAK
jgi:four helix bundle protein